MRAFYLSILILLLTACGGYQRVVKKGSPEEKLAAAKKYYNKKDYARAQPLFEELMGLYFGKPEREEIFFHFAYTHYGMNEYLLAGYYFKSFTQTYPLSQNREEAAYMAAVCEFHKSLPYELDQTNTQMAINSLQAFINQYPNSEYVADCNKRIDRLRERLLKKAYETATLWYKIGDYKAAMVSCNNALDDYPDMINRDELQYIIVESSYIYAVNSIEKVQLERFEKVLQGVQEYQSEYGPDNKYFKEVTRIKEKTEQAIQELDQASIE